ncbi:MAG: hypothetical protein FWC00_00280 [Firmicutes bacterium]|nr:hypothetical protein [Bacillota bacterium]
MAIDLHVHTNHSDGLSSVKDTLIGFENHAFDVISITDHDSIGAYAELENPDVRKFFSGKILNGCEVTALVGGYWCIYLHTV